MTQSYDDPLAARRAAVGALAEAEWKTRKKWMMAVAIVDIDGELVCFEKISSARSAFRGTRQEDGVCDGRLPVRCSAVAVTEERGRP
jgi:hypothetical protein